MRSYAAAKYGLVHDARLEAGEAVLVHGATTALGTATVSIARHIGAEVYATVAGEAERAALLVTGSVAPDHIFSIAGLPGTLKHATGQRGVDVVLNSSVTGEVLRQSCYCLNPFGRWIELGMKDMRSNTGLNMVPFACNGRHHQAGAAACAEALGGERGAQDITVQVQAWRATRGCEGEGR